MLLAQNEIHLWITHTPVSTRAFIRAVLSQYLDTPAQYLHLRNNIHGKPELKDRRIDIRFNASNSHGLTVCTVSRGLKLGVDVEYPARQNRIDEIAARYFHPDEIVRLNALGDETSRRRLFFELWTRKEAFIKAQGKTIGTLALDTLPFLPGHAGIQPAFRLPQHEAWQFPSLVIGDYLVAVAHAARVWQERPLALRMIELN